MEPKKLKEIEDRFQKMPPGSLVSCTCGHCGAAWMASGDVCVVYFTDPHDSEQPVPQKMTDAYRDFFVHAVDDVPLLVATVRALQGDIARLQHQITMKETPNLLEQITAKLSLGKHGDENHEKKEKAEKGKKEKAVA